ncbi:MAG: phosphoribosylanthranilate isomerase [Myxococcota bacterium]
MRTRVKICCIASVAEASVAIRAGADALGLVSDMPSGSGIVDDAVIRRVVRQVPPPIARFLLTQQLDAAGIVNHVRRTGADTVQIVDHVDPAVHAALRSAAPEVRIVQVVHVTGPEAVAIAERYAVSAHAILLDSGQPGAEFRELGGTGRTHDWQISRAIVDAVPLPVWLAGGLDPANVGEAIRTVRPFGVDLCSGVRTEGALDGAKLAAFIAAVAAA